MLHALKRILRGVATRRQATILNYHGVLSAGFPFQVPQHVRVDAFEEQIDYLSRNARCVSLRDLVEQARNDRIAPRTVAVTFDDGFQNNLSHALPILERSRVPATLFVPTGFMDKDELLWPERLACVLALTAQDRVAIDGERHPLATPADRTALYRTVTRRCKSLAQSEIDAWIARLQDQLGVNDDDDVSRSPHRDEFRLMSWGQLERLSRSPWMTIGSHGIDHLRLTRIDAARARDEIFRSRTILEGKVPTAPLFAYPFGNKPGDYTDQHAEMARACGYLAAVAATPGAVSSATDVFNIPRNNVYSHHALADVRYLVQGGAALAQGQPGLWRMVKGIVTGSIEAGDGLHQYR